MRAFRFFFLFTLLGITIVPAQSFNELKIDLPHKDIINYEINTKKVVLNKSDWNKFGFNLLETYKDYFKYSLIGFIDEVNYKALIVERHSENESIHWFCIVDNDYKLLEYRQSAYDNSEGFTTSHTVIYPENVKITTWNIYEENKPGEQIFMIKGNHFLEESGEKDKSQEHDDDYYVSAKSGLNFRASPKGKVLGKFPLNAKLKVIEYTNIFEEITDEGKRLKGEWVGVEKEQDTVYVFNEFLSPDYVFSDLNIYYASPYYKQENGETDTGFLNMSESYFYNKAEEAGSLLTANNFLKDTVKLNENQRNRLLKILGISESDKVFLYETVTDSIMVYNIKELPAIACVNIYAQDEDFERDEFQYEFGFDLGKKYKGGYENFVYVGKANPFQKGKLKPMVWKTIEDERFPVKIDTSITNGATKITGRKTYGFSDSNYNFFIQEIEKENDIRYRHLVVINTNTNKVVTEKVYRDSEAAYLSPMKIENEEQVYESFQYTGVLFKNKPPIVYGFLSVSFGCPGIDFLSDEEPFVPILCDNRH